MAQVNVSIAGKVYRMACDDGQEAHLAGLAERLDKSIDNLRTLFGEIGDQRLIVMAAISLADQHEDAERRLQQLEAEIAKRDASEGKWTGDLATAIDALATRVEAVAARVAGGVRIDGGKDR